MPKNFEIIEAAAGEEKKNAKCSGTAYGGGKMIVSWSYPYPCVIELSGMEIPPTFPLLCDHYNSVMTKIGDLTGKVNVPYLNYSGDIYPTSEQANNVIEQAKAGGAWQNSIGAIPLEYRFVEAKETVIANGKEFTGPLYYISKSKLREISVVAIGADDQTNMAIAASFNLGERPMEDPKKVVAGSAPAVVPEPVPAPINAAAPDVAGIAKSAAEAALKAQADAETARIAGINAVFGSEYPEVKAACVNEKLTVEDAKDRYIAAMREARPKLNLIVASGADSSAKVVEAAALLGLGKPEDSLVKAGYKPETIDAARKNFKSGVGLQQMLLIQAQANGCHVTSFRGNEREVLRAAFSTLDIGGILSNVANKAMLDAFLYVEQSWKKIARIKSANDFKRYTSYRLTSDLTFKKVGPGGEIQSGTLGEETYGNQVDAFARLLALTWQDMRNDDLGALDQAAALLGRGAALGINKAFWTSFLDNSTFFSSGNKNLKTSNALSVDGMTEVLKLFRKQTDASGEPLGIAPRYLVVPPGLEVTATSIFSDTNVENAATSGTKVTATTGNPHRGKFEPVPSAYLDNAAIAGGSATSWYLVADPMALPLIEVAFLDGIQTPTIETANADFETIGIKMRGVFAFGVEKQDYRAGVRSNA